MIVFRIKINKNAYYNKIVKLNFFLVIIIELIYKIEFYIH